MNLNESNSGEQSNFVASKQLCSAEPGCRPLVVQLCVHVIDAMPASAIMSSTNKVDLDWQGKAFVRMHLHVNVHLDNSASG